MATIQALYYWLRQHKAVSAIAVFCFLLVGFGCILLGLPEQKEEAVEQKNVLGTAAKVVTTTPTIAPTAIPSPTLRPTAIPKSKSSISPTVAPTATPPPSTGNSQSNSQTSATNVVPTNTPAPTATPFITETPTSTPTPSKLSIHVAISYAGQRSSDSYTASINPGQTAWDAVKAALGMDNVQFTDYGGDLGVFVTGFNGVSASSNQFYEFRVNGASSNVGVSSYLCNTNDALEFVLTTF